MYVFFCLELHFHCTTVTTLWRHTSCGTLFDSKEYFHTENVRNNGAEHFQTICIAWASCVDEVRIQMCVLCCCVNGSHPRRLDLNTSNYYFTSCSLSAGLFRSRFRKKLPPQWQWKCFSPHCSLMCPFKLTCSVNAFAQTEHKAIFTTLYHKM